MLLRSALTTETPQPIAALVEPPDWTWDDVLDRHDRMKGRSSPARDPGRSAGPRQSRHNRAFRRGLWCHGVLCLPGTVSAWNPKAVRASAGSIFRVPFLTARAKRFLRAPSRIRREDSADNGPRGATRRSRQTWRSRSPSSSAMKATACRGAGGTGGRRRHDSLPRPRRKPQAAVAASVLLYEASRQRSSQRGGPRESSGGPR